MDLGHWQYPGEFNTDEWFGFIYRIIDTTNGMHYIGKKQFWAIKRKTVKGRKNKKVIKSDSDWKTYTSSSDYINDAIKLKGKENFTFLIEALYKSKGSLSYAEIEYQINEDVLRAKLSSGDKKYYNKAIGNIKFIPPDELSEETKFKISTSLTELYQNKDNFWFNKMSDDEKEIWNQKYKVGDNNPTKRNKSKEDYTKWIEDNCAGKNNPMHGKTGELSPRFGKKPFDNLSSDKLQLVKEKCSHPGEENGMYGRHPFANLTEDEMIKVKEKMSHPGEENGMYGRAWYLNASEEEIQEWKTNISRATKGKPKSEKTKSAMRVPKGPQKKLECPYCKKIGGSGNMIRFHFDNCKMKPQ